MQVNRRGIPVSADLILEIDGRPIRSLADLSNAMDDREPGDRVRLIVARDGVEKLTLEVELTELER